MPPKIDLVRAWLVKAQHHRILAGRALAGDTPIPDGACFHAQQMVEKALKVLLVFQEVEPLRTHLIDSLLRQCGPIDARLTQMEEDLVSLTGFAVDARYPDLEGEPTVEVAREALAIAERAFQVIIEHLPPEVRP